MRPPLMSCMDALLERLDADALDRIEEDYARRRAQHEIRRYDVLHRVTALAVRHRGPEQRAQFRVLVGTAADRPLIIFLAVLLDAENADVADVMLAARVDA